MTQGRELPTPNVHGMELSARNQLGGVVRAVRTGTIMAEIAVDVEPAQITAAITKASVERLNLREGDRVTVIIKSTEVMIGK
jgi:molybdopterin-binding protein